MRPPTRRRATIEEIHMTAPTTAKAATRFCSMKTCSIICSIVSGSSRGHDGQLQPYRCVFRAWEVGRGIAADDKAAALDFCDFLSRKLAPRRHTADDGDASKADR